MKGEISDKGYLEIEKMEVIQRAAKTLISMCTDYLSGGITDVVFVRNLDSYTEQCNGEMKGYKKEK